jgi:hypothetical protein
MNENAEIKAALYPRVWWEHGAGIGFAQAKVVTDYGCD